MNHTKTRHGHSAATGATGTYNSWRGMIARCHYPSGKAVKTYQSRGITVCDRWRYSFANFLTDMGEKPDGYELDRINNSEGYYPGNCRYVTRAENQKNKTNSKNVTHNGKSQSVKEWAVEIGIDYQTLMYRIKRGWPMQRAMSPSKMYSRSDFQRRQA